MTPATMESVEDVDDLEAARDEAHETRQQYAERVEEIDAEIRERRDRLGAAELAGDDAETLQEEVEDLQRERERAVEAGKAAARRVEELEEALEEERIEQFRAKIRGIKSARSRLFRETLDPALDDLAEGVQQLMAYERRLIELGAEVGDRSVGTRLRKTIKRLRLHILTRLAPEEDRVRNWTGGERAHPSVQEADSLAEVFGLEDGDDGE